MRHERIYQRRGRRFLPAAGGVGLFQRARYEAVFLIGERRFDVFAQRLGYPLRFAGRRFGPHRIAFAAAQLFVHLAVAFQHLHRKVAGREGLGQLAVVLVHVAVQSPKPLFDDAALTDMDMPHPFVLVFVDGYDRVQQGFDALAVARFHRNHRHAQHPAQTFVVELRAA